MFLRSHREYFPAVKEHLYAVYNKAAHNNIGKHSPLPKISTDDLSKAVKRMESRNSTPGQDPNNVLVIASDILHKKVM